MATEQQTQQKQKYLRQNIDADHYEDFAEFFANQLGSDDLDIGRFTLDQLKNLVNKFNVSRIKEEQQHQHQRSFAIYQTTDIQQAYQVLTAVQNNIGQFQSTQNATQSNPTQLQTNQIQVQNQQNYLQSNQNELQSKNSSPTGQKTTSPQKPNYKSASDLLDSVMSEPQRNTNTSPQKNSPQANNSMQNKFRSNSQIMFQKGNIWATTANIQNQRKSTQFDNFWQFSANPNTMASMNKKKQQEFKTQNPFSNQAFQFVPTNNKSTFSPQVLKATQPKKNPQPIPSFQELNKNISMSKKPNSFGAGYVQPPSNMKKQQQPNTTINLTSSIKSSQNTNGSTTSRKNIVKQQGTVKQIKLIAQKPINQPSESLMSVTQPTSMIKSSSASMASVYAYKGNKIPYKGQTVHKTDFKDVVKCYQASVRTQLNDKKLQVSIQKHQIVEKNFFVADYVMYYMSVKPLNIVCKRNYQDFTKLKAVLQKFYPGMQLPWLEKNSWFETNAENIKKQKVMLQFFMNDLVKNPEIRNSRIFEDFLTLKEHKAIKRKFQEYAKMDQYKSLQEMVITGGKVQVVISEPQRIYHQNLEKLVVQFEDMLGRKNKLVEILGTQFQQLNETLTSLSKLSAQMSEQVKKFNQSVTDDEIPSLEMTFNIVSKSYQEWASRISFESKVVTKRLVPFYKFQKDNLETMKSLIVTEGQFYKSYIKRSSSETATESYNSSALKSAKMGILQQSRNMTVMKYQLGYLSNMLCKQSVRFFQLMGENFKAKWIYKAEKYNQRLSKDVQFYNSICAMAR